MKIIPATRVLRAERRGSSLPVIVDTPEGSFFTKLRGAAQAPAALVAEVLVAELAEALGLRVPQRILVRLDGEIESDDRDEELRDLLRASHGLNLGFAIVEKAHDLQPADVATIDVETASRIVWLDGLVLNPDRGVRNPNILLQSARPWLIDHGAALGFHHDWGSVTEESPRRNFVAPPHVLRERATVVEACDERLAAMLSREVLQAAVDRVPDEFLLPLLPPSHALVRRRAAYVAFLWKRLKAPRPFVPAHS